MPKKRAQDPSARRMAEQPTPQLPPDAGLDEVRLFLSTSPSSLALSDVQLSRNHIAQLVLSDPALAHELSGQLLDMVQHVVSSKEPAREAAPHDLSILATAWRSRAESSLFSGLYPQSREAYNLAVEYARAAGDGHQEGQMIVGFTHVLSLLGATQEAAALGERAEKLLRRAGDHVYLSKLLVSRGNLFYQRDEYRRAYDAYRKAEKAFDQLGLRDTSWASLLVNQAIACTHLTQIDKAREIFRRVETHCDREGIATLAAHARYNRSFLEALRGDYREALRLLEQAEGLFAEQEVVDMVAASLQARAEIYFELNMPPEALDLSEQAAEAFAQQDMAVDHALARLLQARSLQALDRLDEAATHLGEVSSFFKEQKNETRWASTLLVRADVSASRGALGEAVRLTRSALRVFTRHSLSFWKARAERQLARLHLQRKQTKQAEDVLAEQRRLSQHLTTGERLELWTLAGRISIAQSRPGPAARQLRRAAEYLEIQRQLTPGLELRSRAFEEQVRTYHELIGLELTRRPRAARLFPLMEAARARGFRERLALGKRGAGSRLVKTRANLGAIIKQLHEAEFPEEGPPDRESIEQLRRSMGELEREAAEHARRLLESRPVRARRDQLMTSVQSRLRADEILLEYFVLGDQIVSLLLTRDDAQVQVLPPTATEIKAQVGRLRFMLDSLILTDRPAADLGFLRAGANDALGVLHKLLIEPLAGPLAEARRLLIIPHQILHRVPFECLWDGTRYLSEIASIVRCPTAELLLRRPKRASSPGPIGKVLVCGTQHPGLGAIGEEVHAVAQVFSKRGTKVLEDPSSEEILAALPKHNIVHLSSHGVFREDNPNFSYLSTRDGALFLMDLYGQRLSAELVTLSACNTGQAFTGKGDDMAGVAHGFLSAGARQLLAGQWRVHDQATREFMEAFYRAYVKSKPRDPAAALSVATAETREHWDHPFYWGAFGVHGS